MTIDREGFVVIALRIGRGDHLLFKRNGVAIGAGLAGAPLRVGVQVAFAAQKMAGACGAQAGAGRTKRIAEILRHHGFETWRICIGNIARRQLMCAARMSGKRAGRLENGQILEHRVSPSCGFNLGLTLIP